MMLDILGWIGNVFFITGGIFIARKSILGFYGNACGNILYAIQGYMLGLSSLMGISICLCCLNVYGLIRWRIRK